MTKHYRILSCGIWKKRIILFLIYFNFVMTPGCGESLVNMLREYKPICNPEECFDAPEVIALCHAIEKQDIEKMEQLIADGADVNAIGIEKKISGRKIVRKKVVAVETTTKEISLLRYSLPFGEKGLECLLKHGANPNYLCKITLRSDTPNAIVHNVSILCDVVDAVIGGDPRFKNYVDFFLKYGADPDLGDTPPLISAAAYGSHSYPLLVSLVEAGADLNINIQDSENREYPITRAASNGSYKSLLHLLESGAAYDVTTIPGGTMQRILYKQCEERKSRTTEQEESIKKNFPKQFEGMKKFDEDFKKVTKWLEDHGVSFDKPVPFDVSTQKPEPFRVNNKLIEMRQKNAEKLKNDKNNANENPVEVK